MNSKAARIAAVNNGHQPGMYKPTMVSGRWHNRTYCQRGCRCFLEEGALGVYGTMLNKKCTRSKYHAMDGQAQG